VSKLEQEARLEAEREENRRRAAEAAGEPCPPTQTSSRGWGRCWLRSETITVTLLLCHTPVDLLSLGAGICWLDQRRRGGSARRKRPPSVRGFCKQQCRCIPTQTN
jgi:hypothetical protein